MRNGSETYLSLSYEGVLTTFFLSLMQLTVDEATKDAVSKMADAFVSCVEERIDGWESCISNAFRNAHHDVVFKHTECPDCSVVDWEFNFGPSGHWGCIGCRKEPLKGYFRWLASQVKQFSNEELVLRFPSYAEDRYGKYGSKGESIDSTTSIDEDSKIAIPPTVRRVKRSRSGVPSLTRKRVSTGPIWATSECAFKFVNPTPDMVLNQDPELESEGVEPVDFKFHIYTRNSSLKSPPRLSTEADFMSPYQEVCASMEAAGLKSNITEHGCYMISQKLVRTGRCSAFTSRITVGDSGRLQAVTSLGVLVLLLSSWTPLLHVVDCVKISQLCHGFLRRCEEMEGDHTSETSRFLWREAFDIVFFAGASSAQVACKNCRNLDHSFNYRACSGRGCSNFLHMGSNGCSDVSLSKYIRLSIVEHAPYWCTECKNKYTPDTKTSDLETSLWSVMNQCRGVALLDLVPKDFQKKLMRLYSCIDEPLDLLGLVEELPVSQEELLSLVHRVFATARLLYPDPKHFIHENCNGLEAELFHPKV